MSRMPKSLTTAGEVIGVFLSESVMTGCYTSADKLYEGQGSSCLLYLASSY